MLYFNAALSVGTKGTSNVSWDLRKTQFQTVADAVELNYGKFGSTEAGRDTKSVRSILGTLCLDIGLVEFFQLVKIQPLSCERFVFANLFGPTFDYFRALLSCYPG